MMSAADREPVAGAMVVVATLSQSASVRNGRIDPQEREAYVKERFKSVPAPSIFLVGPDGTILAMDPKGAGIEAAVGKALRTAPGR
jgi:hypothetical protein